MRVVLHRFQHFHAADAREHGAVGAARAFGGCVLEAQVERIHAQLERQFVDNLLGGECGVGSARRAVCGGLGLVHHYVVAVDGGVLYVVGGEYAHSARAHRRALERAGFVCEIRLHRGDAAVVLCAYLYLHIGAAGWAGCLKDVGAAHNNLDGTAALFGEQRRHRL